MVLRVTGRHLHKKTLKNMSIYYSKWVYEEWNVCFLYSDAFDLQFGVVIYRLKASFDATIDQHLLSHSTGSIQPQDDIGKSRVVTDEQIYNDSPPLGSVGGQRESIWPLLPSSSPSLAYL